jgi:hypothetical protein
VRSPTFDATNDRAHAERSCRRGSIGGTCCAATMTRDIREVVAESVAYAVCSRFGLDLSLRSVDYVAGWLDDPAAFRAGMAAIHDAAASLIDAIEAAMTDVGEVALAA